MRDAMRVQIETGGRGPLDLAVIGDDCAQEKIDASLEITDALRVENITLGKSESVFLVVCGFDGGCAARPFLVASSFSLSSHSIETITL